MDMAKVCLKDGSPFGVCLILEGSEVGDPALAADVGTLAKITAWDMPQLGVLHVIALGSVRFRVTERRVEPNGLARGTIEELPADDDGPIPATCAACIKLLDKVIDQQPAFFEPPLRKDSSSWVSARLTELLPLPLSAKQELLELSSGVARLERLNALLGK
jgi:Lon protease-like protein